MNAYLERAIKNRTDINNIRRRYLSGEITREEAMRLAKPILDRINSATLTKTRELNKKYNVNRKPVLLDFVNAMRNNY